MKSFYSSSAKVPPNRPVSSRELQIERQARLSSQVFKLAVNAETKPYLDYLWERRPVPQYVPPSVERWKGLLHLSTPLTDEIINQQNQEPFHHQRMRKALQAGHGTLLATSRHERLNSISVQNKFLDHVDKGRLSTRNEIDSNDVSNGNTNENPHHNFFHTELAASPNVTKSKVFAGFMSPHSQAATEQTSGYESIYSPSGRQGITKPNMLKSTKSTPVRSLSIPTSQLAFSGKIGFASPNGAARYRESTTTRGLAIARGEFGRYMGEAGHLSAMPIDGSFCHQVNNRSTINEFLLCATSMLNDFNRENDPLLLTGTWDKYPWCSFGVLYRDGGTSFRKPTKEQRNDQRHCLRQYFSLKSSKTIDHNRLPSDIQSLQCPISRAAQITNNVRDSACNKCDIEEPQTRASIIEQMCDHSPDNAHAIVILMYNPNEGRNASNTSEGSCNLQGVSVYSLGFGGDIACHQNYPNSLICPDKSLLHEIASTIDKLLCSKHVTKYVCHSKDFIGVLQAQFSSLLPLKKLFNICQFTQIFDIYLGSWLLAPDLMSTTSSTIASSTSTNSDSRGELFVRSRACSKGAQSLLLRFMQGITGRDEVACNDQNIEEVIRSTIKNMINLSCVSTCSKFETNASLLLEDILLQPSAWFSIEFGNENEAQHVITQGYHNLPSAALSSTNLQLMCDANSDFRRIAPFKDYFDKSSTLLNNNLVKWYRERELPFTLLLSVMEIHGIGLNLAFLSKHRAVVASNVKHLEKVAGQTVSVPFSINSHEQVAHVLYDVLKLERAQPHSSSAAAAAKLSSPGVKRHHSTSESVLQQLKNLHPLPSLILQYRSWHKTLTTYLDPFITNSRLKQYRCDLDTERSCNINNAIVILSPTWNQTGTGTGRLSCSRPNLQSMPKNRGVDLCQRILKTVDGSLDSSKISYNAIYDEKISETIDSLGKKRARPITLGEDITCVHSADSLDVTSQIVNEEQDSMEYTTETSEVTGSAATYIRDAIVPVPNSSSNLCEDAEVVFISADYKQFEMRLLAHLSGDSNMEEVFRLSDEGGSDIYCNMASQCFQVPGDQVSNEQREKAKRLSLGLMYGMGRKSLAEQLTAGDAREVTVEDAEGLMNDYFGCYPKVKLFIESVNSSAQQLGYVTTLSGRRRLLPHISEEARPERVSYAYRQSINTIIQGSCSDMLKETMVSLFQDVILKNEVPGLQIVLQLHDEIVFQVPHDKLSLTASTVRQVMEKCIPQKCKIKFPVRIQWGKTWGTMEDYVSGEL